MIELLIEAKSTFRLLKLMLFNLSIDIITFFFSLKQDEFADMNTAFKIRKKSVSLTLSIIKFRIIFFKYSTCCLVEGFINSQPMSSLHQYLRGVERSRSIIVFFLILKMYQI